MEENKSLVEAEITPQKDVGNANLAANQLKNLMDAKPKKVIINGKRHLEFDDWQTIAAFFRSSVKTEDAQPVEVNGIKGFKARAEVIDKNGKVIGGAEAYCMHDEEKWKNKPTFQLASMAQTRAGSKALSNVYRWVVVMGGFAGTPAEEMTGNEKEYKNEPAQIPKKCNKCNKEISEKTYKFSVDKYHTPLCFDHQKELQQRIEENKAASSDDEEIVM